MKSENLRIRINPILKERIKEEAEKDGKSISEWIMDLIKIEMAKREQ